MKSSDVLNRAAEYMLEHGMCKGHVRTDDGRVCLIGAVSSAIAELEYTLRPGAYRSFWYLYAAIPRDNGRYRGVASFNDTPATTEPMAIGVLLEAALLAKEAGD